MIGLWTMAALATEPCPDPAPILQRAESDAVNYYLADAQKGLLDAVKAWSCAPPIPPADLGSYLRIHGLLASYDQDEAQAERAFGRAKHLGATFNEDFGPVVKELWTSAAAPEGEPVLLSVRGRDADDWLAVDGEKVEGAPTLPPGLHLVQVGTGDVAHFARILDARGSGLDLSVRGGTAGGRLEVPIEQRSYLPPFLVNDDGYADGMGQKLSWQNDLMALAERDAEGIASLRRYRSNTPAQVAALTLTPAAAYGTYVFGWDATQGYNLDSPVAWSATLGLAAATVAGVVWEARLLQRRGKHRRDIVLAAERAAAP